VRIVGTCMRLLGMARSDTHLLKHTIVRSMVACTPHKYRMHTRSATAICCLCPAPAIGMVLEALRGVSGAAAGVRLGKHPHCLKQPQALQGGAVTYIAAEPLTRSRSRAQTVWT
jgi:hypothetical protein